MYNIHKPGMFIVVNNANESATEQNPETPQGEETPAP